MICALSRSRMMTIVGRTQVTDGDVRIDLFCGNVAMTKQCLHGTRISAVLQQVRREAVPQGVRRNVFDSHLFRARLDHEPCEVSRKRLATIKKNIRRGLLSIPSFYRSISLQPVDGALPEWYSSFFATFAVANNQTRHYIDIGLFQSDHF